LGHEVSKAGGPEEALTALESVRPDILVVDVMMPTGTEGFHLVWRIRQLGDEQLRAVPIIMATGIHQETELRFYPDKTDGTYAPGEFLPVQGWLDKPVRLEDLAAKIEAVLAG
jgi:two-component system OmpR family response regulator